MADTTTRADRQGPDAPDLVLPRRLWSARAVAAVALVVLVPVVSVFVLRLLDRTEFESTALPGPVDRIDVQLARGSVELVPASPDVVDVEIEKTTEWRFSRPSTSSEVDSEGGTARIRASCPRIVLVVGTCSVDYRVQVPSGVRVTVRTDSGTVTATGLDGWLRVVTSGGRIVATDLSSPEALIDSGGGSVTLAFESPPSRVETLSRGGAVDITLPDGAYDVRTSPADAETSIAVPTDRSAERSIVIDSGGGHIRVR